MKYTSQTATYLAAIWGASYALFIQRTEMGRTLAKSTTWLSVVIGVGGDLLISLLIVPFKSWQRVAGVFALSSLGIIARSLVNEIGDIVEVSRRNAAKLHTR